MTDSTEPDDLSRRGKSPDAFRTISEAASELDVPQHVLRFWETRFPQLKPLKRAGGRRYYRPEDLVLLRRIRALLYSQGYTIRGAQKLLRDGKADAETGAKSQPPVVPTNPALDPEIRAALREILTGLEAARTRLNKAIG